MGQNRWIAAAPAIAQVDTLTVAGTAANGNTYTVTSGLNNDKIVTYTANGTDTNNTIAVALQALLSASIFGEFQEITWTVTNNVITATMSTPGTPFTIASSVTGTGTLAHTTTINNSSPNDWNNANNWSLDAVPVAADDVWIDFNTAPILFGLAQSAVTLNSLNIAAAYTGTIGLPEVNTNAQNAYEEYRPTYLSIGATTVNIGYGSGGQGSGRIKLNSGSVATTLNVFTMGQGAETNLEALQWKGTNVANVVEVQGGDVAIAGYGNDTATVATLTQTGSGTVRCGQGTTLTTVNQSAGTLEIHTAATTIAKTGGTLNVYGSGAIATLTDDSGATNYLGAGTITTLNVGSGCTFTFAEDGVVRTVTNANLYAGGSISDFLGKVTWSNPIQLVRCRIADVTLDLGQNRKLLPS